MKTLAEELRELQEASLFTFQEMAIWFDCFPSAMRQWVKEGVTPTWVRARTLRVRAEQLRWALMHDKRLPVPTTVSQYERKDYVRQVKDESIKKFSQRHSAGRGAQVLDEHPQ